MSDVTAEARTGGEVIVDALEQAGVRTCFGVPGESFLGVLDALYGSSISFVSTRHEGGAAFMASGYSKISRQIGVCLGTRAVGTANLAVGIHNARQDSTPMIALAGQVNRDFAGREAFQEVDLVAAMTPYAKWAVNIPSADLAGEVMARALNIATSGRPGPVFVSVPQDVCEERTTNPAGRRTPVAAPHPDLDAISTVLDALLEARAPLLFTGGGLYHDEAAYQLLVAFAEAAEIPVVTNWRHHDGFPNDHRLFLGSAGLGAAPRVWDRVEEADVICVLGNRMQENATAGYQLPRPETRLFQVDIDPSVLVNHRSPELALQADAAATLADMLRLLPLPVPGAAERRLRNDADRKRFEAATTLPDPSAADTGVSTGSSDRGGVPYAEVFRALGQVLPAETIVSSDAGNFYAWLSRYYRFTRPNTYVGPASGAMGYGLPGAIGAKLARPAVPVVSLSGDGGLMMTLAELDTAVRQRANVVAVVLDNARHGTIRMHQERRYPGRVVGTELASMDLSLVARGLGARGYLVDEPGQFADALSDALAAEAPAVVQVRMDRDQLSIDRRLEGPPG